MNHVLRRGAAALLLGGAAALLAAGAARAQDDGIGRFDITRYDVQGNTLLPDAEVQRLVAPYTGKGRDFGAVQQALETLEGAYRKRGYSVVQVVLPEQELNQGVVRLQVVETKVASVKVTGNKFFTEDNIRRSLPALKEGETPNITAVSASLKVANENPAKQTTLQLQPGAQDGVVDAVLDVRDSKPWTVGAVVDNTGDTHTGRNHLTLQYQNANVSGRDDVASLQYTTSFAHPDKVSVYGAGYHLPLYSLGDSIDLYGSYSDVNSGTVTAGIFDLAISGKGTVLGARYNHNLARVGNYDSKVIAGLDYKAFQSNVSLLGIPLGSDVTVHPMSLTYTGNWASGANTLSFYVSEVANIPGGNDGGQADFNRTRAGASDAYTLTRFGASFLRDLPRGWQLHLALNGQATGNALVPGEQFGAGGASSVRGFEERDIANDQGWYTNAEVFTPNLCNGTTQCRVLGFWDTGRVSRNNVLPGESTGQGIASVGVGVRFALAQHLAAQADYAHVTDGSDITPSGSKRISFRVLVSY